MKVEHLIVDTNGFVKNLPLHELGENIYTTREVVAEIRDGATRQRLQALPYELQFREPLPEYLHLVTKLSKVTGDYTSLSAVDIQLIALAYQISKEKLGPDASAAVLKSELDLDSKRKVTILGGSGMARQRKNTDVKESITEEEGAESLPESGHSQNNDQEQKNTSDEGQNVVDDDYEDVEEDEGGSSQSDGEDEAEEDDDDDEEGWITPSNYKQKIKEFNANGGAHQEPDETSPVACLTNDFSMQNLMLHIGIKVLSSSGMLIKQLRTFILRCYTCFHTTSKMEKLFCPECGHKTLKRVSITVNPDGTQVIHLSRRVTLTGRGKKYPLPIPQGGKHSNNPIVVEDQPIPQQRPTKQALRRNNPLDFAYITGNSPFVTKDLYSRAAMLGINTHGGGRNYWDRKNPNEPRKTNSRRKKTAV